MDYEKYYKEYYKEYYKLVKDKKIDDAIQYKNRHVPSKVYKFYNLNTHLEEKIKTLLADKIRLSSFKNLNDPYEGKGIFLNEKKIKENLSSYESLLEFHSKYREMLHATCFAGDPENTNFAEIGFPMWAYYSDNSGICVEYSVKKKNGFHPVLYEEKRTEISVSLLSLIALINKKITGELTKEEEKELTFYQYYFYLHDNIKHASWRHESEYRIIYPRTKQGDDELYLDLKTIGIEYSKVYLGINFNREDNKGDKDKLINYFLDSNIPVSQMYLDDNDIFYKLKSKPFIWE